jgi:prevent-host-death family protein
MPITISSREFNQDISAAKRAALQGPVFITDRGKPALVLLNIDEYRRIASKGRSLLDTLTPPASLDLDFEWEPGRATIAARAVDLEA